MRVRSPTTLEYHLPRLETTAYLEFVSGLWSARGGETARDVDAVVARNKSRLMRTGINSGDRLGREGPSLSTVDAVVAPGGGRRVRVWASSSNARLLDAPAHSPDSGTHSGRLQRGPRR
jgi:hypothetical protein